MITVAYHGGPSDGEVETLTWDGPALGPAWIGVTLRSEDDLAIEPGTTVPSSEIIGRYTDPTPGRGGVIHYIWKQEKVDDMTIHDRIST